jgi:hypothetical protein
MYLRPIAHLLRHARVELILGVSTGVLAAVGGFFLLGSGDSTVHSSRYGDLPTPLVGWGAVILGVYLVVVFPITIARRSRRAVLAADADGVFIRPNLDPKRALYLPWHSIESISVRAQRGPNLCVKPVDARVETPFELAHSADRVRGIGASYGQNVAQRRRLRRLGTNIAIPIGGSAVPQDEIIQQLRHLSAGRVLVAS